ncbi:hypothetical protein [Streptosporangium sandarakinum]|uniref:hypothetical protein n=1 Tax=Streptosporangium sandarakinum TaxID=1260955 RepID=UPI00371570CE
MSGTVSPTARPFDEVSREAHPGAFLPSIATGLNNFSIRMVDPVRRDEAPEAITEAAAIREGSAEMSSLSAVRAWNRFNRVMSCRLPGPDTASTAPEILGDRGDRLAVAPSGTGGGQDVLAHRAGAGRLRGHAPEAGVQARR